MWIGKVVSSLKKRFTKRKCEFIFSSNTEELNDFCRYLIQTHENVVNFLSHYSDSEQILVFANAHDFSGMDWNVDIEVSLTVIAYDSKLKSVGGLDSVSINLLGVSFLEWKRDRLISSLIEET